jgi:hypothetical protein
VQLDARPDRLDLRDRPYIPRIFSLAPCWPEESAISGYLADYVKDGLILDQGKEGACTGYGLAATVNFMLWTHAVADKRRASFLGVSPHMFYDLARFYDEWPGENYEGSSCRGAMKGWHKHGACAEGLWSQSVHTLKRKHYLPDPTWAQDALARPLGVYYRIDRSSVTDMQAAIAEMGAIYVSAAVHGGWDIETKKRRTALRRHADLPIIDYAPDAAIEGAHSFCIVGYNERGFVVQNSWSTAWGASGFAVLSYADWVDNGTDAWVCSLGVPQAAHAALAPSRTRRTGSTLLAGDKGLQACPTNPAVQPWSSDQAYAHTLVAGNNGVMRMSRPDIGHAEDLVDTLVFQSISAWLQGAGAPTKKIVIYAHGGLNSEGDSIERIRVMAPYFTANGIYPLFYTWRTGFIESLGSRLQDVLGIAPTEAMATGFLADAKDALIEAVAHGIKWVWNEMKDNAEGGKQPGRALDLLARSLSKLVQVVPAIEVHLVGHSAGSFVHGHLIELLKREKVTPASITLFAPACSLEFAAAHYMAPVVDNTVAADRFWLHLLSDAREQYDTVGPYGKSLLYLVDRGFENTRKTPLAGLQHALDSGASKPDDDLWAQESWPGVKAWRAWVAALPVQADGLAACEVVTADYIRVSTKKTVEPGHGSFDNNIDVLTRTINRVLGAAPNATLGGPVEDLDY